MNALDKRCISSKFASTQKTKETKSACRPEHDVVPGVQIYSALNNVQDIDSDGKALKGWGTLHMPNPPSEDAEAANNL